MSLRGFTEETPSQRRAAHTSRGSATEAAAFVGGGGLTDTGLSSLAQQVAAAMGSLDSWATPRGHPEEPEAGAETAIVAHDGPGEEGPPLLSLSVLEPGNPGGGGTPPPSPFPLSSP